MTVSRDALTDVPGGGPMTAPVRDDAQGHSAVGAAADLPIKGAEDRRMCEPLAKRQAVFAGQPVALVVAESETAAQDGVDAVQVDYTPIEPTVDAVAAMAVDAALARPHKHNAAEDAGQMAS